MTREIVDLDTPQPEGERGDTPRLAFTKINENFAELYRSVGSNMLINGDGRINQRLFVGGVHLAGAFGYDNWFADTGGANWSVNQATGVITHTNGTMCQAIESPRGAFGVSICVSVGDLTGTLNVSLGGATGIITAGLGRRYVNIVAPNGSASGNLLLKISANNATYRDISVVRGADMSGFMPRPVGVELLLARRIFQKSYELASPLGAATLNGCVTGVAGTANYIQGLVFPVTMRAAPAVGIYSSTGTTSQMTDITGANPATGIAVQFIGQHGFLRCEGFNITIGTLYRYHYIADAGITS
ncbi:hypothetical protein JWH04_16215 [Xanthomonas melonis]|uniref:hypothetical protein n=1 Tax=Xanthomonas melonis TaxID=56456 RepID=UPI001E2850AC|nr:hypothetical protein [Xanthomonas melonis]MCD0280455.1 hypothetical protein [Xanthomonas melonis]